MDQRASIEKLYILDGGLARVEDGSTFWPGVDVGRPVTLSCNAYLLRHRGEWLMWDTGTPDELFAEPGGRIIAHGIRGIVVRTIASQLAEIGVSPRDIRTLVVSHAHYDHVGNSRIFENARWIAQKAERDAMFGDDPARFGYLPELYATLRHQETQIIDGDHDVFGDGAVRIISTPGHTLGHCSLTVRLPEAGLVLLSGDVAHNRANLRHRRVPSFNADPKATLTSMERIETLAREERAAVWLNHDTSQSGTLPHAPASIV